MLMSTSLDAIITNLKYHVTNTNFVNNNVRIIDFHKNWNVYCIYIKVLIIKELKPILNKVLKAPEQLVNF